MVPLRKCSRNTQYSFSGQTLGSPVKVLSEKLVSLPIDRNGTVTEPKEKGVENIPLCVPSFCWGYPLQRLSPVWGKMLPQKSNQRQAGSCTQLCPQLLSSCRQPKREKSYCHSYMVAAFAKRDEKPCFYRNITNTGFFAPVQKHARQNYFWNKYFPEVKCASKSPGVAFQNLMWMAEPSYCWPVQRQKKKRQKYGIQ